MTTIAYNHKDKEIAYDSRLTCGSLIVSDEDNKAITRGDVVYISCGDVSDINKLIDNIGTENISHSECNVEVYFIKDGKFFRCVWPYGDSMSITPLDSNRACGSGADFALAAMDFGKNAKDAVEYAKTRDCKTGGKVKVFKVGEVVK